MIDIDAVRQQDLSKYQREFERAVRKFMAYYPGRPLNQKEFGEHIGWDGSKVSNLIGGKHGKYKQALVGRDVLRCVLLGVFKIEVLGLRGETVEEQKLIEMCTMLQDTELLELLYAAHAAEVDLKDVLRPIVNAIKKP